MKQIGANPQLGLYPGARNGARGRKKMAEGKEDGAGEPEMQGECSNGRVSIWLGSKEVVATPLRE